MFKDLFLESVAGASKEIDEEIILEGYNFQDVISFLQKSGVPHRVSDDMIQVPSRFFDDVKAAIKKFKGRFKQFDAGDHTVIKMVR